MEELIWNKVLEVLKTKMNKPAFNTWMKSTELKIVDDTWNVIAPNAFIRDWLEARYLTEIHSAIASVTDQWPIITIISEGREDVNDFKLGILVKQIRSLNLSEREKLLSLLKNEF